MPNHSSLLRNKRLTTGIIAFIATVGTASAQDHTPTRDGINSVLNVQQYSPYVNRNFPTQVFFGDTHLHTMVSVDAGTMNRLTQEEAFRFARGEQVTTTHGLQAKLSRPLDFVAITDHAEMYGLMPQLLSGDPEILSNPTGKRWFDALSSGDPKLTFDTAMEIVGTLSDDDAPIQNKKAVKNAWNAYTAMADQYNEPGRFTAMIGFEWTSVGADNIHRNVILRGGSFTADQTLPFSLYDSKNPEDLWAYMDEFETRTRDDMLAIPHNGNLSNGRMFNESNFDGTPLTPEMAALRARFEPLVETTQIKGDSEAHPFLSPGDEFADFDTWDAANLNGTVAKTDDMLKYEYSREALKTGLKLESTLGTNPYKYGQIGSTDVHTALAAVEENNFFGKHSGVEPEPGRWEHIVIEAPDPAFNIYGWKQAAGGYAGVWATENTRAALFDAMERKEVYGTTGSRMTVRFFGGYDFDVADTLSRLPADAGYAKGVPMGGDLVAADGRSPNFIVGAMKDPYSGNLDRIQIIKGWLDGDGATHEKVYDVVWSGDRVAGADGKLPSVGNTVDVENATWTNSIGAPELIGYWSDPDFDAAEKAFYYVRVIEIPTPRWTAYEAMRYGIEMGEEVPMTTTERAYTSPIWYTPKS